MANIVDGLYKHNTYQCKINKITFSRIDPRRSCLPKYHSVRLICFLKLKYVRRSRNKYTRIEKRIRFGYRRTSALAPGQSRSRLECRPEGLATTRQTKTKRKKKKKDNRWIDKTWHAVGQIRARCIHRELSRRHKTNIKHGINEPGRDDSDRSH